MLTKHISLARLSLLSLTSLALGACAPPSHSCRADTRWDPDLKMCIPDCGTPEHPTYDNCYVDGSYVGSDASEAGAVDAMTDTGVAPVDTGVAPRDTGVPTPDAAMEAGPMCAAPSVLCGGSCVMTDSDLAHCGGCNRPCTTMVANARATCAMGMCDVACDAGFEWVGANCEARIPRPIAPMTSATVTSQRPTLEWELPSGVTAANVDVCRDRAMTMGCVSLMATGTRVRPSSALAAGVWFWRVRGRVGGVIGARTSPVWWFRVGHADAAIDTFHGVELDVNGDGFGDVAVGAPGASPGGRSNAGAIYVFWGGASGLPATPSQVIEGGGVGDSLGERLTTAGDVDGDGFVDLVAARAGGIVEVYRGSAMGLQLTPSSTLTAAMPRHGFGSAIAAAGDVDGDGYGDLVVGASSFDDFAVLPPGTVSVHRGSNTGVETTSFILWSGEPPADYFGWSVAGAGDVNGDRLADIAIGESDARDGMARTTGAAHVFLGRRSVAPSAVPQRVLRGTYENGVFGGSVLVSADTDGDGYSDLLVATVRGDAPPAMDLAVVLQFRGGPSGVEGISRASTGLEAGPGVLADAGDTNRDGRSDVYWSNAFVQSGASRQAGQIALLQASSATSPLVPLFHWYGMNEFQLLGSGAGACDMNGDGRMDLVATDQTFSLSLPGRLNWYVGGANAPAATPMRTYAGTAGERFGASVAQ